jgi:hypothetical protein
MIQQKQSIERLPIALRLDAKPTDGRRMTIVHAVSLEVLKIHGTVLDLAVFSAHLSNNVSAVHRSRTLHPLLHLPRHSLVPYVVLSSSYLVKAR